MRRTPVGPERAEYVHKLRARYEKSGLSIRSLVALTGYSYGTVRQLLAEAGTAFRSRGGARRRS